MCYYIFETNYIAMIAQYICKYVSKSRIDYILIQSGGDTAYILYQAELTLMTIIILYNSQITFN